MQKSYVIVTDSCSDLGEELRKKYDIEYLCMRVIEGVVDKPADLDWQFLPAKTFYDKMRQGTRFTTAQITCDEYVTAFEQYIQSGKDIISISCSSALSGSYAASAKAREQVIKKYPEARIYTIDALNACSGLGLICITASKMRADGKSVDQTAAFIEANKLKMHQVAYADDLVYLKRAGRVAPTSAFFGGIFKIKPIIISDANGQNVAAEKVKGGMQAKKRLLQLFEEHYDASFPYQMIAVAHADSPEESQKLAESVREIMPDKNVEMLINYIGPIVGATVGPGTMAVYFWGDEVTYKA